MSILKSIIFEVLDWNKNNYELKDSGIFFIYVKNRYVKEIILICKSKVEYLL